MILSTFERPEALRVVLEAYARSSVRDFEVIVADDGSGPETADLVKRLAGDSSYALRHVWQPHQGFRLAAVRNLAVRSALGDILVLTDGDCVPLPNMLEPHVEQTRPGTSCTGGRCLMTEDETAQWLAKSSEPAGTVEAVLRRELPRLSSLRRRNRFYSATRLKTRPKLLTANASVHRSDFERVNGFDERFVGWGYEDEDLARRLRRLNVRIRDASTESLVLHLFHPVHESHRPNARGGANYKYFVSGRFLTRPLRGLRPRSPGELLVEVLGDRPGDLAAQACAPTDAAPEVTICIGPGSIWRRPRGQVVLRGFRSGDIRSMEQLYRILEERL